MKFSFILEYYYLFNQNFTLLTFGRGYPTNLILDNEGKVYFILSGGSSNPEPGLELYWKQHIKKLLRQ